MVVAIVINSAAGVFRVDNIIVKGTENLTGLSLIKHEYLFLISEDEMSDAILARNPQISKVRLSKQFPDTVVITVSLNTPVAYLSINGAYVLFGSDGRAMQKIKELNSDFADLPSISYYQPYSDQSIQVGDVIGARDFITAVSLIKSMEDLGVQVETVDIPNSHMIVLTQGKRSFVFTPEKDSNTQIQQARVLLRQFLVEGREFTRLDLRFNKPIVKF
ncbi:MAG: cell division protein FtsQ/DivIB [Candidatus Paceibacterota bacterium]